MKTVTVLIPTCDRPAALAVTLASLAPQTFADFRLVIADQGAVPATESPSVQTALRVLRVHGIDVDYQRNLPQQGIAHNRQFLLDRSDSPYSLYLDDDLLLEPYVIESMVRVIAAERCGFVGSAVIGLSYLPDVRPHEQHVELWDGPVQPERIYPHSQPWHRFKLHNAANLFHVQSRLQATPDCPQRYKVAWVGGCVLYDTEKLLAVGGFNFWRDVPPVHCGEEVYVQLRLMDRYGGCGIMPSGVYHQEWPTTLPDRTVNLPEYLLDRLFTG